MRLIHGILHGAVSVAQPPLFPRLTKEHTEIDLEIEPGMVQGQELKFVGEGEPHPDGAYKWRSTLVLPLPRRFESLKLKS
jgi:hypothetical protein